MAFDNLLISEGGNIPYSNVETHSLDVGSSTLDIGPVGILAGDYWVGAPDAYNGLFVKMLDTKTNDIPTSWTLLAKLRTNQAFIEWQYSKSGIRFAMYPLGAEATVWKKYITTPLEDPISNIKIGIQMYYGDKGICVEVASTNYGQVWYHGIDHITLARYGNPEVVNFSPEFGPASKPEGYEGGSFDDHSDTILIPEAPTSAVAGSNNVYKLIGRQKSAFISELYPSLGSLRDIGDLVDIFTMRECRNAIISYHMVPVEVPCDEESAPIILGYKTLEAEGHYVHNDYVDFDCGLVHIPEYYANFLDYLTTFSLYLPFYGFVPIKPEWIQGSYIRVKYRFNIVNGSFIAFIIATSKVSRLQDSVVAQYSGSCVVNIPLNGLDYANMFSGIISAATSVGSSIASGGITMPAVAGSITSLVSNMHGDVTKNNSYNAPAAFMGVRRPYFMVERPVSDFSETYEEEEGFPLNVSMKLSEVHGYTEVGNIHLDSINCTAAEKQRLDSLLKNGVIF